MLAVESRLHWVSAKFNCYIMLALLGRFTPLIVSSEVV